MVRRIAGALLVAIGVLGITMAVLGTVSTWRAADEVTGAAQDGLDLTIDALDSVEGSLRVASTTLDGAVMAMEALYTATLGVGETLSNTQPTLDGIADLAEGDLPASIDATLGALEAMEQTATTVDTMLRGLSRLGLAQYDPALPLDQSIREVRAGLRPVPDDLREMADGLRQTTGSLTGMQADIEVMSGYVLDIQENVGDANSAVSDYGAVVQRLRERLSVAREGVRRPVRVVAWGLTLLLTWIGLSQLALVQWGVSLWRPEAGTPESDGA
jgi:methyl-accepting chemotaxis protein